jgi:hypothetical protein
MRGAQNAVRHNRSVDLAEWQSWWRRSGSDELNRLLWERWDPIGGPVGDGRVYKPPRDEYASYVGDVGRMLREGAEADEIASYLRGVEVERMRLTEREETACVAEEIVAWYGRATSSGGAPQGSSDG